MISGNNGDGIIIASNGLPVDIVSWYRAEGNATDFVGDNHGTLANSASFAAAQFGQGFVLDGANEDRIDIPDDPTLDLTSVTIEAWINLDTQANNVSHVIATKRRFSSQCHNCP